LTLRDPKRKPAASTTLAALGRAQRHAAMELC